MSYSAKHKAIATLAKITKKEKANKKRVVFTNGCFDLIHPGHVKVFEDAKKHGDILIVALNSDKSVRRLKGSKRPILSQESRVKVISALEVVDYVVVFEQDTPYEAIKKIKPDILVKGGDWKENEIIGADLVKKVVRVKIVKNLSTTNLIKRIIKAYGNGR